MKILLVGHGNVGRVLARRWAQAGHDVTVAAHTAPEGVPNGARSSTLADASVDVDAVVIAVPFVEVGPVAQALDPPVGIVVVDTSNPVRRVGADEPGDAAPDGSRWGPATPPGVSAGSANARHFPRATYVKAFSSAPLMVVDQLAFADPRLALPYAGAADPRVDKLIEGLGFEPVRIGDLAQAYRIEMGGDLFGPPQAAAAYRQAPPPDLE